MHRCALTVPATQSQAYGHMVVPTPLPEHLTLSSHARRAVHTHPKTGHTYAHTKTTHRQPCMTGISLIAP